MAPTPVEVAEMEVVAPTLEAVGSPDTGIVVVAAGTVAVARMDSAVVDTVIVDAGMAAAEVTATLRLNHSNRRLYPQNTRGCHNQDRDTFAA